MTTRTLRDLKRLPVDISHSNNPVNVPSKFKLFQANSTNTGNLFGFLQYAIADGVRVSARSLDSRAKITHDSTRHSTPVKMHASSYETVRGAREHEIGATIPNLYSTYKTRMGSVVQVGCGIGLRAQSVSRGQVTPYLNPKFTYFGPLGWVHLNMPLNKKNNRLTFKHHAFFSVRGNTMLSSLEVTSTCLDGMIDAGASMLSPMALAKPRSEPTDTIHYKVVHVASATELGVRRINKTHGTKWQLEFGLKHSIASALFVQCLFTHTIADKTNFGLSFGLDI
eukprot:gene18070-21590_t